MAGLWAARERKRLQGWLGERRLFWAGLGAALYAASLWEFGAVHESTRSLGLAASFLKPMSALFVLAACAFFLGTTGARAAERVAIVRESPPAGAWEALATGSFAIYLLHGSVVLSLLGIAAPRWQAVVTGRARPLLLGAAGSAGPLAFYRLTERFAPGWPRFAMFG